jgi:Fe-S cluster assembly protein SufD
LVEPTVQNKDAILYDSGMKQSSHIVEGGDEPDWMANLRRLSRNRYLKMKWPTPQEEEWRRTDITGIDFSSFEPVEISKIGPDNLKRESLDKQTSKEIPGSFSGTLQFNGASNVRWSLNKELGEKGVLLASLDYAFNTFPEKMKETIHKGIEKSADKLQMWHYSTLSHGVYLYIPPFLEVKEPFYFGFTNGGRQSISSPHVIIMLDKGARATVIQKTQSGNDRKNLCNAGLDISVSDSAGLNFFDVQVLNETSLYFSNGRASIRRDGYLHHFSAGLGGQLYKSRFDGNLDGSGANALLSGAYFSLKNQHMDIKTVQNHNAPNTNSRAFYKGAVKDNGRAIYQGLIEVEQDAPLTDAYMTNKNLILGDGARADSIPSLKIKNNDVKCSHGSTTGKIDENEVFYLMTRGLSTSEAEKMVILGYFEEVLEKIPKQIVDELREAVLERLN